MQAPLWMVMLVSAVTDFAIAGGGTLMGAIVESGSKQMPSDITILVACLAGFVAAGKEVRSMLKLSDVPAGKPSA